jgi:hypothetical protein
MNREIIIFVIFTIGILAIGYKPFIMQKITKAAMSTKYCELYQVYPGECDRQIESLDHAIHAARVNRFHEDSIKRAHEKGLNKIRGDVKDSPYQKVMTALGLWVFDLSPVYENFMMYSAEGQYPSCAPLLQNFYFDANKRRRTAEYEFYLFDPCETGPIDISDQAVIFPILTPNQLVVLEGRKTLPDLGEFQTSIKVYKNLEEAEKRYNGSPQTNLQEELKYQANQARDSIFKKRSSKIKRLMR